MQKKIIIAIVASGIILSILIMIIINSKIINTTVGEEYHIDSPIQQPNISTTTSDIEYDESFFNQSCFKARTNTIPASLYGNLPKPYINVGLPKMGTTSLHKFFSCGGLSSTHYYCHPNPIKKLGRKGLLNAKCASMLEKASLARLPPLSFAIKNYNMSDAYMQLDDGHYFPQVELLDEIVEGYPNATLFLTFRNMSAWYKSLSNWPPKKKPKLSDRLKMLDIKGLPKGKGKDVYELSDWYCKHVQRVRDLVAQDPSHTLVEVDIQDPDMGQWLESIFSIKKRCWGQVNANSLLLSSNNNNTNG